MIKNEFLIPNEKKILTFFVDKIKNQKEIAEHQINQAIISRDATAFYHVIKFNFDKMPRELFDDNYKFDSTIQVIHDNTSPTVFILFVKNGLIREFEIYNADLSELNFEAMCDGEALVEMD